MGKPSKTESINISRLHYQVLCKSLRLFFFAPRLTAYPMTFFFHLRCSPLAYCLTNVWSGRKCCCLSSEASAEYRNSLMRCEYLNRTKESWEEKLNQPPWIAVKLRNKPDYERWLGAPLAFLEVIDVRLNGRSVGVNRTPRRLSPLEVRWHIVDGQRNFRCFRKYFTWCGRI